MNPARQDARGTIGYVGVRFEESIDFAEKSDGTRKEHKYCAQVAREFKTDKGEARRSTSCMSIG